MCCIIFFSNGFYAAHKRNGEATFRSALKVTTADLGEAVELKVRNNGTGIPPNIKDKLFQPFFTTKPTGEGTGLRLSIAYDIITQQHGGTITVDSGVLDGVHNPPAAVINRREQHDAQHLGYG